MRQAVVVIHGIGEQRPMDTLRGFANAILPEPAAGGKPKFWSKPDRMSEIFELRQLTTPQTRRRPPTDLYEFYWAYHAQGTKISHVVSWALTLLFRKPRNVPQHLKFVWYSLWSLIILVVVLTVSGQLAGFLGAVQVAKANLLVSYALGFIFVVLSGFIIGYLGDAARYLNPNPSNIELRRKIRADGVSLLRKLHESGKYDRVVVVGHSLGSVVGYDIIRHLWVEYHMQHGRSLEFRQDALDAVESAGQSLGANEPAERIDAFRRLQTDLWKEQRNLGNPWLITDFITLGSPLAHAALLLAQAQEELMQRQAERELPTCPPQADDGSYSFPLNYEVGPEKRTIRVLHHAAPYAYTRWTNLFFPAALGFFGDLVGGPLRPTMGHGIKDVAVGTRRWGGLMQHTPIVHTHYWDTAGRTQPNTGVRQWALEALINALCLDSRGLLKDV